MNKIPTIIVADDHPILLKGLSDFLVSLNYQVMASVEDGERALQAIQMHTPDVAILDIDMPQMTGIEVAEKSIKLVPETKVVLMSYSKDAFLIILAKKMKIMGYLLKEDAMQDIDRCIRTVLRGDHFFSHKVERIDVSEAKKVLIVLDALSPKEKEVLQRISEGLTTKEIAMIMSLSHRTIDGHRAKIINKIGLMGQPNRLLQWVIKHKDLIEGL